MAGKIFISYRRDDSEAIAGRLHDRLVPVFGRGDVFMDVDRLTGGVDFVDQLNSQLAACHVCLAVIGANWLDAKDESGRRRLGSPDDFVTIELAAVLARDICVIPVLTGGTRMPKADALPDPIKPLARRQAVEVRHIHFGRDAEALVARVREALGGQAARLGRWRGRTIASAAAVAALLLFVAWGGYVFLPDILTTIQQAMQQREESRAQAAAEAEAKRKAQQAERQRLAALKAEEDRKRAEAEAKRKAEEERKAQEMAAQYAALVSQGLKEANKDKAIATFSKAIELDPKAPAAYYERGNIYYRSKRDYDRAIADFTAAFRLDPTDKCRVDLVNALNDRGVAYSEKGDHSRAIADFTEAIRLDPNYAPSFYHRGLAYFDGRVYDTAVADFTEAIRLDPNYAPSFYHRGVAYSERGDHSRAIADFTEAIGLNSKYALAFCERGHTKLAINDPSGQLDIGRAKKLDASSCR
jgi:tetratricopeptide (TPR) repeat protein